MNIVAQAPALSVNNVFSNNYNIYTIPANDVLHIDGLSTNSRLSVYSISGKELMNVEAVNSIALLSISDLAQGVYFLKISEKGNSEILKFVKE
ncbi:MAG: T9SS type A sorting domain-containing protein [Bacteroidales bacterium]|nr:T9SS type A sorting domain-containing protein [Bacteroidales bacterium]